MERGEDFSKKSLVLSVNEKEILIKNRLLTREQESRSKNNRMSHDIYQKDGKSKIPEEWHQFKHFPDYQKICIKKKFASELELANPFFRGHDGIAGCISRINGQTLTNFANYNYLGLNGHPEVSKAAKDAIDTYGTTVSASRVVSGERPIHRELETALARMHGTQDCLVFVSGHATNVTSLGYLFGRNDLIYYDERSHNSIVQGALLSGAHRKLFPHNKWQDVDAFLHHHRTEYERVVIVVEGIYSMDGDFPDLPKFIEIKHRHKTFLMVDEAHSLGVLGPKGEGIASHFNVDPQNIDICMGTLSKALASVGGYIAGSSELVELLRSYAPGFLYSVGMSPPATAAALAALRVMQKEPDRVSRLRENGDLFLRLAKGKGLNVGESSGRPVVPIIIGSSIKSVRLANAMFERGINVQPIFYPAVEEKAARLRFFIQSEHSHEQIYQSVEILSEELSRLD